VDSAELVKNPEFQKAVEAIRKTSTRKFLPDHFPAFDEKRLKAANLSAEDVYQVLKSEVEDPPG
jgi:hypothetical protein